MLLSSQADFKYDDETSPSNPPGLPPTGDNGSGRGDRYRNIFGSAFGFGGGHSSNSPSDNRGSSKNDDKRRYPNSRLPFVSGRNERSYLHAKPLSREDLRDFALSTLQTLDEGEYFPPGAIEPYDLKVNIDWTEENTRYYGPEAGEGGEMLESEFVRINEEGGDGGKTEEEERDNKMDAGEENKNLEGTKEGEDKSEQTGTASHAENKQIDDNSNSKAQAHAKVTLPPDNSATVDTSICIGEYSTLVGARKVHLALASNPDPPTNKKIGVLNFASAKKPGGGFINGSQAQEESIARASTLYPSLITTAASQFYTHYRDDPRNAFYTHAMVYSPRVVLLRDDNGEWRSPVEVDVLTSAAVNAGEIRRQLEREERLRREREEMEIWKRKGEERRRELEKAMAEREKLRREKEKLKKEKEELAKLKKEKAKLAKSQKGVVKSGEGSEPKETEKGKEKDSGSEVEGTSTEQEKTDDEKEKEKEKEDGAEEVKAEVKAEEEVKAEAEENQEVKPTDSPSSSDSEVKKTEENPESKGVSTQDDQPQPDAPPEVNQEPTSNTISHPLSPETQPSQAPKPDPQITYAQALSNAESEIDYIMYTRISRILHLFQLHQTPHLILGSFGTGVFQNHINVVASIFADLLIKPGGRFKNVFKTVVFAILGKETVRVFASVFSKVEKRAQKERGGTGRSRLFMDENGSDEEEKEDEEERTIRLMRWQARRAALTEAAQAEADVASFAADPSMTAYTSPQDEVGAISFADAQVPAAPHPAAQAGIDSAEVATAYDGSAPVIQTDPEHDGEVDLTTTPKAMIIDDDKDIEMVDIKSLSSSKSNEQEEGDIEMQ